MIAIALVCCRIRHRNFPEARSTRRAIAVITATMERSDCGDGSAPILKRSTSSELNRQLHHEEFSTKQASRQPSPSGTSAGGERREENCRREASPVAHSSSGGNEQIC